MLQMELTIRRGKVITAKLEPSPQSSAQRRAKRAEHALIGQPFRAGAIAAAIDSSDALSKWAKAKIVI